jgi:hypothetical protein
MDRLDLVKSRSFIVYEPALPVFARDLGSGVGITRQANFKMYDLETGRLKRFGRVTHLMKRVSRSRFETPAGLIDGYYVEAIIGWICNTRSCTCRSGWDADWMTGRFMAPAATLSRSSGFLLRQKPSRPDW